MGEKDYVALNREGWTKANAEYTDRQARGAWAQDDWSLTSRLTVNLGLRYDLIWNAFANDAKITPWIDAGRPNDTLNLQPRLGAAYKLNDATVLRVVRFVNLQAA